MPNSYSAKVTAVQANATEHFTLHVLASATGAILKALTADVDGYSSLVIPENDWDKSTAAQYSSTACHYRFVDIYTALAA
jgi:hypothetical protein